MKKFFILLLAMAGGLCMSVPVRAQLLGWGVKGGVNLSAINWKGGISGNKDNSTGFFIGPMAELTIPLVGVGLDAALMYSQRGNKYEVEKEGTRAWVDGRQRGMEIPVNLKYTFGLGRMLGLYVAAGPDFFFNFKHFKAGTSDGTSAVSGGKEAAKKTQVGLNLGAGVKLLRHLQVGINYQIPMGDSFTLGEAWNAFSKSSAKTKTWQVSAAYLF